MKRFIERTKEKVMMTATVATVVTARKVSLKGNDAESVSESNRESSPRNHVIIVKIGICP